jgi:phosphonate transport system ATP-binding protein
VSAAAVALPPALELRGVSLSFGARAVLRDVDLVVPQGQCVALIGPSGTGKTTLMRLFAGTLAPQRGQVLVLGRDLAVLSARQLGRLRARLGLLYQNDALVPGLRVVHNVLIGRLSHWGFLKSLVSLVWPRDVGVARAALQAVGLADRLEAPIATLSGGQRQRVAIARLLAQDAELILADEPATHLDPRLSGEVIDLLLRLARERGRTCIVSLHDVDLLGPRFDRVLGLRDGRWFHDGPAAALAPARLEQLFAGEPPAR